MWYYMVKYSFDPTKIVNGPFKTEEEAYQKMLEDAQKEHNIDVNENSNGDEWETEFYVDDQSGEITIVNYFGTNKDVTEFFIFEI